MLGTMERRRREKTSATLTVQHSRTSCCTCRNHVNTDGVDEALEYLKADYKEIEDCKVKLIKPDENR